MPDRFVQQDARPARAEHDRHLARGRRLALDVQQCLAQRFVHRLLQVGLVQQRGVAESAAAAVAAAFAPAVLLDDDGHAEPDQRPQVGDPCPVGADDLHRLPLAAEAGHDLLDPRVAPARVSVEPGQRGGPVGKARAGKRVRVRVEPGVGLARRGAGLAGPAGADGRDGPGGPAQRGLGNLAGMGEASLLAEDRAQAEAELGVEPGAADAALLEAQLFALTVFQEQLAVVHAVQRGRDDPLRRVAVEVGPFALEEQAVGGGEGESAVCCIMQS